MNSSSPIHVGAVVFDLFELLDLFGPLEFFGLLERDAEISVIAESRGPVRSSSGPAAMAEGTMAESAGFDVLLIPGGIGTRTLIQNPPFLTELKRLAQGSQIVATICTGSMLLASTGLLNGRNATSNKRVFQLVKNHAPEVRWMASPDYSRSSWQCSHMHGCRCVGGMDAGFLRLWAESPLTRIGRSGCDGFRRWSERCWNDRRPADRSATKASCRRV